MAEKTITFNDVPEAMTYLIEKFDRLENLIESAVSPRTDEVQWMDIDTLCEYLPDKPAKQTVYGWVCKKIIPFHKKGKKAAIPEKRNRPLVALRRSTTGTTTRSLPDLPQAEKKLLRWPRANIPTAIRTGTAETMVTIGATGSMRRM